MSHALRPATLADAGPLARLWHGAWHDAHGAHLPPEVLATRTEAEFRARISGLIGAVRMAGPADAPTGFCAATAGSVAQLFVARGARRAGLGRALLADGEARLRAAGTRMAKLHCHPENARAIALYAAAGWRVAGRGASLQMTARGMRELPHLLLCKAL